MTRVELEDPTQAPLWAQSGRATSTAADGSFVLDGPAPTGRLGVAAIAAQGPGSFLVGKVEEALEFQAPAKDLVLRLPPKAPRGR